MKALPPVRRIITGDNAVGRSYFVEDGESPAMVTSEARPGYRNNNLWRTRGAGGKIDAPDSVLEHSGIMPPPGGTVLRTVDFPPEDKDPEARKRAHEGHFKAMFPDAAHKPDSDRHPGMHTTETIDYAIVLSGEIVAIMDEGETVMRAGDILIQRGTSHAWANRSDEVCRVAFVLMAAER